MAIACFLLVTFFPLLPLLSVPFFFRRIADSTRLLAAFPYFLRLDDFRAAIGELPSAKGEIGAAQAAIVLALARQ